MVQKAQTSSTRFNDTAPTSSVFSLGTAAGATIQVVILMSPIVSQRKKDLKSLVLTQVMVMQMVHLSILGLNQHLLWKKGLTATGSWLVFDNKREWYKWR